MPDDSENAPSLVPAHLAPWAKFINRGWPIEAGPMPSAAEVQQALELGATAGTKVGLAWTMYCRRPDGASHKEVTSVCGGPQRNAASEAEQKGKVSFESRKRADGTLAHFLGPPGSDLRKSGAEPIANLPEELRLDPDAVTRWIERLRFFFPSLDRFDRPDPDFDEMERKYKLETAAALRASLAQARDDETLVSAVVSALQKSNLLQWRVYWPMTPRGDGNIGQLAPALRAIVAAADGPADGHAQALAGFAGAWTEAVPNPQPDHARQIGEFILMHLAPETGIYIRHSVRERFWHEGFGTKFPASANLAETYRNEIRFMRAVRDAFTERGLAPRDLIDVQGALWVVHHYTDSDNTDRPAISMSDVQPATNLILYGPPGTGKTYRTAWEAVRLCLGADAAASLQGDEKRDALMVEYRRFVGEGRIEFVTFHQSMTYEEFVEGLRPTTDDEGVEGPEKAEVGTGFRLKPHDGVFKRISERARLDRPEADSATQLDRSARVFKVALGRRQVEDDRIQFGLDHGLIHVGWGGNIDWSDERFDDFNEILATWRSQTDPEATGHDGNVVITYSFRSDMQVGDYVVVSDGRDRIQAFGKIASEYFYDPDAAFHPHRRHVEWLWRDNAGTDRSRFYPNTFRRHSVYKLDQSLVDWDALEVIAFGSEAPRASQSARDHVLIIDEINRANISKVFGELITLLEPDKRLGAPNEIRLMLPYSKKAFGVPANLHIIGTMNTADRSIALLDTALRRRFTFRELMPNPLVLSADVGGIDLQKLLATINDRVEYLFDREHQIGHAYFTGCKNRDDVEDVMRHKVIPLLAEYFYEDWCKVAAVLGDTTQGQARFLKARQLATPAGSVEDEVAGEKLRWRVMDQFDFSEFEA